MAFRVVVLPAPVASQERDDLSSLHHEGDALEHLDHFRVDDGNVVEPQQGIVFHGHFLKDTPSIGERPKPEARAHDAPQVCQSFGPQHDEKHDGEAEDDSAAAQW